jgi:hypothetical protein
VTEQPEGEPPEPEETPSDEGPITPETEQELPDCPPGFRFEPEAGECVPESPPPTQPPIPTPEPPPCPFADLPFPWNLATKGFCDLWDLIHAQPTDVANILQTVLVPQFNAVGTALNAIAQTIIQGITSALTTELTNQLADIDLQSALTEALSTVEIPGLDALNPESADSIQAQLNALGASLSGQIETGNVDVAGAIKGITTNMIPDMLASFDTTQLEIAKKKIVSAVSGVNVPDERVRAKLESLATKFSTSPDDFTDGMNDLLQNAIIPLMTSSAQLDPTGSPLTDAEALAERDKLAILWTIILTVTTVLDGIVEIATAGQVEWVGRTIQNIIWAFGPSNVLKDVLYGDYTVAVQPVLERMRRRNFRPHRLRIQEGAELFARGNLDVPNASRVFADAGIPNELHEGLLELGMSYPSESEVHKLFFRELVDETEYTRLLRKSKLPEALIEIMKKAARPFHTISNLIRLVVKEVITIDNYVERMIKQGFTREQAIEIWDAHWELPSVQQAYEMNARGEMTEAELLNFLVIADFDPRYRSRLFNIRFKMLPRVDIRRAFAAGVITFDNMVERYKKLQFSPEDALLEAQLQMRETLNAEIGQLRSDAIADYKEGYISVEQLRVDLTALGFSDAEIELSVEDAVRKRENELKDEAVRTLQEQFRRGKITVETYRSELSQIIVDVQRVEQIIAFELSRIRTAPIVNVSDVSVTKIKTDLTNDFVDGYIALDTLVTQLTQIGLSPDEIDVEVANAELRFENKLKDEQVRFFLEAFRKDQIDEGILRSALETVIVRPEKVEVIVQTELAKKKLLT